MGTKKNGKSESGLALVDNDFSALVKSNAMIQEAAEVNLMGQGIEASDLERIKIPAGGSSSWEIPTFEEGETDTVKHLEGVIVFQKAVRAYWMHGIEDGGTAAPDCHSDDSITGIGSEGNEDLSGLCAKCPNSKFGSAIKGKGQACKQMLLVFFIREEAGALPQIIVCPPTSIKPMRGLAVKLTAIGIPFNSVLVRLSLETVVNDAGIKYSKVSPKVIGYLKPEVVESIKTCVESLMGAMEKEGFKEDDVEGGDTSFDPDEIEKE